MSVNMQFVFEDRWIVLQNALQLVLGQKYTQSGYYNIKIMLTNNQRDDIKKNHKGKCHFGEQRSYLGFKYPLEQDFSPFFCSIFFHPCFYKRGATMAFSFLKIFLYYERLICIKRWYRHCISSDTCPWLLCILCDSCTHRHQFWIRYTTWPICLHTFVPFQSSLFPLPHIPPNSSGKSWKSYTVHLRNLRTQQPTVALILHISTCLHDVYTMKHQWNMVIYISLSIWVRFVDLQNRWANILTQIGDHVKMTITN